LLLQNTYDGLGRCVKRAGYDWGGSVLLVTYDGWKPIVEWNGAGNWQAWNVYGPGPDEILWRYEPANTKGHLRYHHDAHGNVTALLTYAGEVLEKYSYDAFGRPTVTDANGTNPRTGSNWRNRFMFTGREYYPHLWLYDYRNRWYDPQLGRFLQTDPLGFDAGDLNLFRYCGDDPVDLSDPLGLEFFPYNGPAAEVDQLYGGAGLGQTRVVTPVSVVSQADGTYTLRLDVGITGILVANRVKFHGKMETRSAEQKRVTVEEHERGEHTKDWRGFHDSKQAEVPSTRYRDRNEATAAAKAHQEKVEGEARKARNEFEKHPPDERWKNIRELPH
jgi:RHS repeat-associated protein